MATSHYCPQEEGTHRGGGDWHHARPSRGDLAARNAARGRVKSTCFSFLLSSNLFPCPCIAFHRCLEAQPIRTAYLWYRVEQAGLRTRSEAKEIQDCIGWWVSAWKTWVETCDKLQKWSLKRWSLYLELESELVWVLCMTNERILHIIQAEDQKLSAQWNLPLLTVPTP